MDRIIKADLYRYGGLTGFKGLWKGLKIPGFRYMFIVRMLQHNFSKFSLKKHILLFFKNRYDFKYGFQILPRTIIGEGFYIGHCGTIVINGNAKIGKNCNITHNVTIGQANRGVLKGYPTLGDRVWIGTGTVIVGNINIGSNVLIAPNSYVNFNVPDNSIVIGNPGKIIPKENATEDYINFILE